MKMIKLNISEEEAIALKIMIHNTSLTGRLSFGLTELQSLAIGSFYHYLDNVLRKGKQWMTMRNYKYSACTKEANYYRAGSY